MQRSHLNYTVLLLTLDWQIFHITQIPAQNLHTLSLMCVDLQHHPSEPMLVFVDNLSQIIGNFILILSHNDTIMYKCLRSSAG